MCGALTGLGTFVAGAVDLGLRSSDSLRPRLSHCGPSALGCRRPPACVAPPSRRPKSRRGARVRRRRPRSMRPSPAPGPRAEFRGQFDAPELPGAAGGIGGRTFQTSRAAAGGKGGRRSRAMPFGAGRRSSFCWCSYLFRGISLRGVRRRGPSSRAWDRTGRGW